MKDSVWSLVSPFQIYNRIMSNVLIVEDEFYIAEDLSASLKEMGHTVVAVAETAGRAIELLQKHPEIEVVLLDIHLGEPVDGVHIASVIKSEYGLPFIFTTAFSDPATIDRVKRLDPAGYLIKPYTMDGIRVAIDLALGKPQQTLVSSVKQEPVFIKSATGMVQVNLDEIIYLEAYDYYSNVFTSEGKIMAKMTLKELMEQMNHPDILRVHRSYAVNLRKIDKIKYGEIYILDHRIPVGRAFRDELKEKIKVL